MSGDTIAWREEGDPYQWGQKAIVNDWWASRGIWWPSLPWESGEVMCPLCDGIHMCLYNPCLHTYTHLYEHRKGVFI